jgi:hypothetical protein
MRLELHVYPKAWLRDVAFGTLRMLREGAVGIHAGNPAGTCEAGSFEAAFPSEGLTL